MFDDIWMQAVGWESLPALEKHSWVSRIVSGNWNRMVLMTIATHILVITELVRMEEYRRRWQMAM